MTDRTATLESSRLDTESILITPSPSTSAILRGCPSLSMTRAVSRTAGCSTAEVTTVFLEGSRRTEPRRAQLSLSVPPLVKNTVDGSDAPMSLATLSLAFSTAGMTELPNVWKLEGFP